jgi:hypothetical protein
MSDANAIENNEIVMGNQDVVGFSFQVTPRPLTLVFCNHESGRSVKFDFGGDELIVEGDLPVDESARLVFEAIRPMFAGAIEERAKEIASKKE